MKRVLTLCVVLLVAACAGVRAADIAAPGDAVVVVLDKSDPAWPAFEALYTQLAAAIRERDFDAFQALRTADFATVDQNGRPQTSEQMTARTRAMFARVQPPITVTFRLDAIKVSDDQAVVTVRQHFTRRQMVGETLSLVDTSATQDETWVMTEPGWKLKSVSRVRDLDWFVDGKRVEPGKPAS